MNRFITRLLFHGTLLLGTIVSQAQTNTVEFGQNRVQFKNFKWRYYQSRHFNTYFAQNGLELGKYAAQVAEKELPQLEQFMESNPRQRINIVVYNSFGEMKQSNIGIGVDWQNTGGVTKLVGNKMIVYFDGNHENLRRQIRQGIARIMLETLLFGEDIGEFAGNAALIDFPKWFTDGFIGYAAENWTAKQDEELKLIIMSGKYSNFNALAYDHTLLAGQAFWYYVESKYGKDAVPYLMYITRINRGLKKGFEQVLNQTPKKATKDFFVFYQKRFQEDNRRRKTSAKGRTIVAQEITPKADYYRFNPNPKNNSYAVVEFKKGVYRVQIQLGWNKPKVLLHSGVMQLANQVDPNYPQMAWNTKGNRLAVVYEHEGKTKLMIYDLITRTTIRQELNQFDRIIDFKYMPVQENTLLLSAVKNGHTDIFTYNISNSKTDQITNDVYDDLDPSFAAFPGKSGILYSSNRPGPKGRGSDTSLLNHPFNIFMVDNWNRSSEKQITQLTDLQYGNAKLPMQYNTTHFTFVSDANGIRNRYAGFFKSQADGVDSLFYVGSEILHNPDQEELDSAMAAYGSTAPDSVEAITITKDSTYTFPISNYPYGIQESRITGEKGEVSEVVQYADIKRLMKLKVDTVVLKKRNITAKNTNFRKAQMHADSLRLGLPTYLAPSKDTSTHPNFFQNEFGNEPADTSNNAVTANEPSLFEKRRDEESTLKKSKLFPYKFKFASDYLILQLDNSILVNKYQPFTGPPSGPIRLTDPVNGLIRIGVSDLFEDLKFNGGFRIPSSLQGSEYFFTANYLKKRFDYKFTYYRKVDKGSGFVIRDQAGNDSAFISTKMITNIYQGEIRYPFDQVRSIRLSAGIRTDKLVIQSENKEALIAPDYKETYALMRLEYVYDNTINPAINIWNGTRYKIYGETNAQLTNGGLNELFNPGLSAAAQGRFTYNMGVDIRHYTKIYRNFIWATRFAMDMSWGTRKLLYYLGGVDNWLNPQINTKNPVNLTENYAFQTLAENLRGYKQNARNGNNVMLLNTELRLPVFATFIDKPINSAFLRNFQVTSFIDIGTAWNKKLSFKDANYTTYDDGQGVTTRIKEGFLGPFVGGYGFGARTTIAGYFLRADAGWPAVAFFRGSPIWYFGMGVDF
ncbi:hypothetical protein SAMN05660461_2687 [Chitinophaga ginsengisegetis]|uniref:WD40-like Beta Propeller Repeat n=1 Tax=Chitinophaga ginsengisegetis TaxID=393003 RepID=A0A1T5NRE9_9BACT|nr:hypothetical protein [Chitinophaga ginsengisegetis]MDR6565864.1 hypothetical protein [Chitinophaga ginsengisegetis]MDR6645593.1 hypothetical protein [Chitinophaga ginsengisegetis]MDR6651815.1 hypothetical protein [Chitinophaga ginsengisegetis]SKD02927.1 hypothetical protein SAMN05660461_2687 [Chitinophaga ginsengisegetis]